MLLQPRRGSITSLSLSLPRRGYCFLGFIIYPPHQETNLPLLKNSEKGKNPLYLSFRFLFIYIPVLPFISPIPKRFLFQIPINSLNHTISLFSVMTFFKLFLLFSLFSLASSHETSNSHLLPRPLIIEYPENIETDLRASDEELKLQCSSWRLAVETNNLSPWKTIPPECADYVKDYITSRAYGSDLERVAKEAAVYARSVELSGDGKDVWIFDVDETLLSNLPYYADHSYGLEVFDSEKFDKWVEKAMAPAIESSLNLYEEVLGLGFKVFLLTGRSEKQRSVTVENLMNAGFQNWDKLILRASDDHGKLATIYKSEKRSEMVKEGYRILGNSGDQWSDLLGSPMSVRSFKLPNPMYYIP